MVEAQRNRGRAGLSAPRGRSSPLGIADAGTEFGLDVVVTPSDDESTWSLVDLLGRSLGHITQHAPDRMTIHPDGQALETMAGIKPGPFATLDDALAEIERHTRGVCRRKTGQDQA